MYAPFEDYDGIYPKGARAKKRYLNFNRLYDFLVPPIKTQEGNYSFHSYLYKLSNERYQGQFWIEIIAYRLGCLMGVEVPPSFIAIDSSEGTVGAFIEWMYDPHKHAYREGGDFLVRLVEDYDLKRGEKHNFASCYDFYLFMEGSKKYTVKFDFREYWAKVFIFDALIGNTDRHQNNWAIIANLSDINHRIIYSASAFDNGTSMGHELIDRKVVNFDTEKYLRYVSKGRNHMRWDLNSPRLCFFEFILRYIERFPNQKETMLNCLKFDINDVEIILKELAKFDVPEKLSLIRIDFIIRLIKLRRDLLIETLEKNIIPNALNKYYR